MRMVKAIEINGHLYYRDELAYPIGNGCECFVCLKAKPHVSIIFHKTLLNYIAVVKKLQSFSKAQ